jgi:hypothetical protein
MVAFVLTVETVVKESCLPNKPLQPTPYSLRFAPAFGRG